MVGHYVALGSTAAVVETTKPPTTGEDSSVKNETNRDGIDSCFVAVVVVVVVVVVD